MGNEPSKKTSHKPLLLPSGAEYAGDVFNGRPHGVGVLALTDKGRYEGQFVAGKRQGQGKMFYPNGEFYNGSW